MVSAINIPNVLNGTKFGIIPIIIAKIVVTVEPTAKETIKSPLPFLAS